MLFSAIANATSCEILDVIRFFHAENIRAAEMRRELCTVYGQYDA
jgi:hypothetical protein